MHFIPVYPDAPPLTGPASPTTLACVCRRWRQIAFAIPALWRAIRFRDGIPYERARHMSETWIKRSGAFLLSISVDIDDPGMSGILTTPLSTAMATARWEHLRIRGTPSSLPKTGSQLPMFHSLELVLTAFSGDVRTFYDAPQLRTVLLQGSIVSKVTLPWIQLTCMTLKYVWVTECVRVLAQTPNLIRCTVIIDGGPEPDAAVRVDLGLPFLESLVLKNNTGIWSASLTPAAAGGFLGSLTTPSLRRLDAEDKFLGPHPIAQLESLVSKSGSTLQDVCIRGTFSASVGNRYRQAFPSIPTFSFPDAYEETTDEDEFEREYEWDSLYDGE
ncbi:F-box domain-containing protein [Mycena sanguinolenta]|uniref:F-box domain-containing protein n=1 Tax=Mycena sanguinolenta TaxID=230812 RepID=A0A8H6ZD72_9AGAR|nr:F-box domain-containing protein [Mycena sanguinolenta]